jgi:RimJ/RimL family protein N-acetyltransferase
VVSPPEILETERLRLRKPILEDAKVIFREYAQDPEVTKFLTWLPNQKVAETQEFIRGCLNAWHEGRSYHWVIARKRDNSLLGMITARVDGFKWELGYVLARSQWNQGYMTEAVKAVTGWALAQPEIYRVWAVCDVDNVVSARVLEKAGMRREGLMRRWSVHPNISPEPRDSYCYSVTK